GQAAIGFDHVGGREVVAIAPNDAYRLTNAVQLVDEVEHLRSVAGNARSVAEPLRPQDRIGTTVAKTHCGGAAVECPDRPEVGQRIRHVGLAGSQVLQTRLRTLAGARVAMR